MIIALEEARRKLLAMRESVKELHASLQIDTLREKASELEAASLEPNFWDDPSRSTKVMQQIKQMQDTIAEYETLCGKLEDALVLSEMAIEENDEGSVSEVESELAYIEKEEERMRMDLV